MAKTKFPVELLQEQLRAAQAHTEAINVANARGTAFEVPAIGRTLSTAYEQLRNVAEYAEEHLLLQRAIRRFYKRTINFYTLQHLADIGEELITELTLASYVRNSSYGRDTAKSIDQLVKGYLQTYQRLIKHKVPRDTSQKWILDLLSVETTQLLSPHSAYAAFSNFAYQHYLDMLPQDKLAKTKKEKAEYELCLFIAVHQALLKSDQALVRYELVRMYQQGSTDIKAFARFNRMVTELYASSLTGRLKRAVGKYGAPLRILKNLTEERPDLPDILEDKQKFLDLYDVQIRLEYRRARKRLSKGLVRSIAFIFITKVVIGLAVEIPYDLFVAEGIAFVPLCINILFPPLYMASLKLGLKPPSMRNANALHLYIDKALFSHDSPVPGQMRFSPRRLSPAAQVAYGIIFFVPFAITVSVLSALGFNIVQGIIFFVFLSTASFLGLRLARISSELELVTKRSGFLASVRDFFYLPFIVAGQWISGKYAQANVMAFVLDMAIELPLKTFLRLARQWTRFVNERREEL